MFPTITGVPVSVLRNGLKHEAALHQRVVTAPDLLHIKGL
jgi:hypothetical protein